MKDRDYDIAPCCRYCEHAAAIRDGETMLCSKKGVVSAEFQCKKYAFDPLKRKPRPRPKLVRLEDAE